MQATISPAAAPSPEALRAARRSRLRYAVDSTPGIRRIKAGAGFTYVTARGRPVPGRDLRRIRALVIPPAWQHVWISPLANGHLQATGRDARGRKQYLYHERWREVRDQNKFDRMLDFGKVLPALRARVRHDLRKRGLPREKVVATVTRLLERTLIRIGNEEYAQQNQSYGLTTMRDRHVHVKGDTIHFAFRGKSGVRFALDLSSPRLARIVRHCQDLPGQELFQYLDDEGRRHAVTSADVNEYLRDATGLEFTAKDFRTWSGTVLAACALRELAAFESDAEAKRNIVAAIDTVAKRLGNTRAVCRGSYIHPLIWECYTDGSLARAMARVGSGSARNSSLGNRLSHDERSVMKLIAARTHRGAHVAP